MAGGTWQTMNKIRPGVYINFVSEPQPLGTIGERGVSALALALSWGPAKEIIAVEAGADTFDELGYEVTDPALLLVREALKRSKTLLLYRLNTGVKATATHDDLIVTAQHGGTRGNDITIVVQANIDTPTLFDVYTIVSGVTVDTQTVANIAGLTPNEWVVWSGTGDLTATAGVALTGGADGTVTNADHTDFLGALELQEFNAVGLVSNESTLKSVYAAYVKRLREDEGKKVQAVVSEYPTADYEGVISVKNGVVLADGTAITPVQAVAWVTGATAGAQANQSLTYAAYDDAVDVAPRYTNTQIVTALDNGEFLFTPSNGQAVVESDINTLHTFTSEKGKQFRKNRVMRVLDGLGNDLKRVFELFYIGKVANNAEGRNLLKGEFINQVELYEGIGAIQNFDSQNDITVTMGNETDAVYAEASIQPVDSIEKIYMKVRVK